MSCIRNTCLIVTALAAAAGCAEDDDGTAVGATVSVVGRVSVTCHQLPADVELRIDLTELPIQAVTLDASPAGFSVRPGTGTADGTFTIPDVPGGTEYLLRLGSTYYVTDQPVVDARSERTARCAPAPARAQASTPLTFSLANMTPFSPGARPSDRLELVSFALAHRTTARNVDLQLGDAATPTIGTIDWQQFPGDELLDAAAGDDLYIFHTRTDRTIDPATQRARAITYLVDWLDATGVSLRSGVPAMVSGAFQPAVANRTASFSIDRRAFEAGYAETTEPERLVVELVAHPRSATASGIVLVRFDLSDTLRGTDQIQTITDHPYADPFPDAWKRSLRVTYDRSRLFEFPAVRSSFGILGGTRQVQPLGRDLTPLPILLPPTGIRVGGAEFDAGGKLAFDGHAPLEVSWDAVAGAQLYRLSLFVLTIDGFPFDPSTFVTTGTSLSIPAALVPKGPLASGSFYLLTLAAVQTTTDYRAGHLVPTGAPNQSSVVPSGRFRFTTNCGDGVVQPLEEECDPGGETAACNVDCTKPVCGDGLRNAAAGEQCDTGGDSATCSASCMRPRAAGQDQP